MSLTAKVGIGVACVLALVIGIVFALKTPQHGPAPLIGQVELPRDDVLPEGPSSKITSTAKITPRPAAEEPEEPARPGSAASVAPPSRSNRFLEGQVLLDPVIPMNLVVVEVSSESGSLAGFATAVQLRPEGSLRWRIPETWEPLRVKVGAVGVGGPVAEVPGIAVRPDGVTRDPRLDPLDLRGRLRLITVTVVDPDGLPVPKALVFVEPAVTAPSEYAVTTSRNGSASLVTNGAAVGLRVEAAGFAIGRARTVAGDTRIVLRTGPRIEFRFDEALPALPPGIVAKVRLVRIPEGDAKPDDDSPFLRRVLLDDGRVRTEQSEERKTLTRIKAEFTLDANRSSTRATLPEAGTFEVELSLERQADGGSATAIGVEFPTPRRIVVEDHLRLQAVACMNPPNTAFAQAIRQLEASVRPR
jgi:hypothetical protein